MPSASDKKRLSRENKQQLTGHTQHEEQQEEQTPALRSALSHGSAPNPEARPPAHTFGCALFYGSNKSWNVTDRRIFLSSSVLSFLMETQAWSRKVIYLRTFCYQKDRRNEIHKLLTPGHCFPQNPTLSMWTYIFLIYIYMYMLLYSTIRILIYMLFYDSETIKQIWSLSLKLSPGSITT